jgi:putative membrane protein
MVVKICARKHQLGFKFMDKKYSFVSFAIRWLTTSFGLWVASVLLGDNIDFQGSLKVLFLAGLLLTVLNSIVKPVLVFLTFPFILLTLGLFMIVLNGVVVVLVSKLYTSLHIESFTSAMLAGMIIGLVNYIISILQPGGKS